VNDTRLTLPLPTNRTRQGPTFRKDGETMVVEYDCEQDDGRTKISVLVFVEVLSFEYRQAACFEASDVLPPTELLCLRQSERLTAILNLWQATVGWQEFQTKQGGAERFKHYKLYFDDAGCIDVIASGLRPASHSAVSMA
jgi:hypothetical protein